MEALVVLGLIATVALGAAALGDVIGPSVLAIGLFAGGSLFVIAGLSPGAGLVLLCGILLCVGGTVEVAAARAYLAASSSPGGPSSQWRAVAVLTGIGGVVGSFGLLYLIAMAFAAVLCC